MEQGDELSRLGDADLVDRARAGEDAPYAELFRRHQPAATALARTLTDRAAADDVVAEAFEKLLLRIRAGGGPQSAFRPYLLQTVRTVTVDSSRRTRRLVVADDPEAAAEPDAPPEDSLFDTVYERTTLARAFGALPDRWQTFLWLSFVEGADRQEIATILGINVGGVSALGYRAREGLRRAYLDAHLVEAPTTTCAEVWPLLSGAVRGGLTPTQSAKVEAHVDECEYCRGALAELDSVNTRLGVLLAPLVLGAAAPAYLGAVDQAHGAAATTGTSGAGTAGAGTVEAGTLQTAGAGTGGAGAGATGAGGAAATTGLLGLLKSGAASVAVVASTVTVAVVAMLAVFSAPLGSEPSAAPGPAQSTSDVARQPGGAPADGQAAPTATDGSVLPARATTAGAPTSAPTDSAGTPTTSGPTGDPTVDGPTTLPTSGGPTTFPTYDPTTLWTNPTIGPTAGPTTGPTVGPTVGPTGGATGGPTVRPSGGGTPTATTAASPTGGASGTTQPSQQPTATGDVAAHLGSILLTPRPGSPGLPMRVAVPVGLSGGSADLQVVVTVTGLTNYAVATGSSFGSWSCGAVTPMAGNPKVARVQCSLPGASPADALDLGLDIKYVGDPATFTADLNVLAPAVDTTTGDDTATVALPPVRG